MCYIRSTNFHLIFFSASHPISGRSDNNSIRIQIRFRTQVIQSHDNSTMNYIQKAPNKSFIFNSWRVKPVKRDIFAFASLFGTNSFSVLCTHLIDFNVAVRLRYECFSATYASCVLINLKCFPTTARLSNGKRISARDWEEEKTATRVSEKNGKRLENGL